MRLVLRLEDDAFSRLIELAADERRSAPAQAEVILLECLGLRGQPRSAGANVLSNVAQPRESAAVNAA